MHTYFTRGWKGSWASESKKVVYAAIAANLAIAVTKFTAAALTGWRTTFAGANEKIKHIFIEATALAEQKESHK
jgi:hypothetical protein